MNQFVNSMVLAITKDTPMFSSERLAEAGKMILLGMGAVFSVLALLWGALELSGVLFRKLSGMEKAPAAKEAELAPAPVAAAADDTELIAVLTAAIAAMESAPAARFRVVSFKRK
jgi:sodium pump decarboxylase gamma subunit